MELAGEIVRRCNERVNSLSFLTPYQHDGLWVFDDESVGLKREPFVLGIDTMIDRLTADIPNADKGFTLLFSRGPFPGHSIELQWLREEYGGNWYYSSQLDLEGWLCPALFHYFEEVPPKLYAKAEPKRA